ncbi:hypothetical protein EBE87_11755 [Pseudoroseomonas wenyumeiae]|uniref:Uncharacterized protein n=1 Tax=Teichococcus wenyumeiae TaxID=2478470 RepID=A0A3A9J8V2_9PROT|nr:hypothetical protein D6Z83_28060 [Pseudoroseomonas wenyumeiae]RMI24812.1 hypothetical protein EBE87_11755 [Pseudoroseomonas wenyumeiae]
MLLGACATGPTLSQRLAAYIGDTEAQLIQAMGVPVRSYETEGVLFLQFERRGIVPLPAPDPFYNYGYWGYRPWPWRPWPSTPAYGEVRCDITFALRNQRVDSFTLHGDGC